MSHAGGALIDPGPIFAKIALTPGMHVADLGCGRTGHFVFPASKVVGDNGIVYAVEIIKDILDSIRGRCRSEGYHNVQTVWSDIEMLGKTAIPEGSLNACFLVNVFYLIKNKPGTLTEAARLLQNGGLAVIVDWQKNLGPLGPTPEQKVNPEEIKKLAGAVGFEFVELFPAGDYHFCLILKKV
ncbi:MAG: methyltransferase domain-containing protein [Patescibacteria group bacterium]